MLIQITGTTGSQPPYDVFLCNTGGTSCFFISGNTYIPPNIQINSEDYFPNEQKLLIRTIDSNGCVFEQLQDCTSGTTGTCVCKEYEIKWGHPGIISFTYDPCCPSGTTLTQTVNFPDLFIFSSSTTPNTVSGFGGIVSEIRDICPCSGTPTPTYYCVTINVLSDSNISWVDYNETPQSQYYTIGVYDLLCTKSGSVTSDNGPSSFSLFLGAQCVDNSLCFT